MRLHDGGDPSIPSEYLQTLKKHTDDIATESASKIEELFKDPVQPDASPRRRSKRICVGVKSPKRLVEGDDNNVEGEDNNVGQKRKHDSTFTQLDVSKRDRSPSHKNVSKRDRSPSHKKTS